MLQKFKITSCAFILCLFGLTLITVSPVLAEDSVAFDECQHIKPNGTSYALMKEKKNCFRDLALAYEQQLASVEHQAQYGQPEPEPMEDEPFSCRQDPISWCVGRTPDTTYTITPPPPAPPARRGSRDTIEVEPDGTRVLHIAYDGSYELYIIRVVPR